jgi:hypothetical protein
MRAKMDSMFSNETALLPDGLPVIISIMITPLSVICDFINSMFLYALSKPAVVLHIQ